MWSFFNRFALVVDIYVPLKRSMYGKRFGFVRFKGVGNVGDLTDRIKKIAVDADPISINAARFKRSSPESVLVATNSKEKLTSPTWKKVHRPTNGLKVSFADALSDDSADHLKILLKDPEILLTEHSDDESKTWLQSCALGKLKTINFLHDLPTLFRREGFLDCEVKYVGGLRFLIECPSQLALDSVLSEGKECLSQWFNWHTSWSKGAEFIRPGRLVWLNIVGLPLHAQF